MYRIFRKFYHSKKDMEQGNFYKVSDLGFDPMTLKEAQVVLRKCMPYLNSINQIVSV